ncbi:MAG: tetratricopeptide repeat protein [Firmicutes bacterium]|nr:tetratricopeptide repeat protein [Bacillota bacterium]
MNIEKTDRIGELLTEHLKEMVFDELSYEYLERAGVSDILKDVPVPIRKTEMNNITVLKIALNMAFVIGCDPGFKYRDNYLQYILRNFDKNFSNGLIAKGLDTAQEGEYEEACIYFRGALQVDPDNAGAYYCYGRGLKDAYERLSQADAEAELSASERSSREDIIGRFKAESLEAFEVAVDKDPELKDAYYYLGYAYLNMGLYVKAKLVWEKYMELSAKSPATGNEAVDKASKEAREDVALRLRQLDEPVKIEEGYNMILSGKFEEGIKALKPYTEGRYAAWWPLWFYLGTAYRELAKRSRSEFEAAGGGDASGDEVTRGAYEEAAKYYREVIKLDPSNKDAMSELSEIYCFLGNAEMAEKYTKKIAIVEQNAEADRELMRDQAQRDAGIEKPVKMN